LPTSYHLGKQIVALMTGSTDTISDHNVTLMLLAERLNPYLAWRLILLGIGFEFLSMQCTAYCFNVKRSRVTL